MTPPVRGIGNSLINGIVLKCNCSCWSHCCWIGRISCIVYNDVHDVKSIVPMVTFFVNNKYFILNTSLWNSCWYFTCIALCLKQKYGLQLMVVIIYLHRKKNTQHFVNLKGVIVLKIILPQTFMNKCMALKKSYNAFNCHVI